MSLMAWVGGLRTDRKVKQEITNAGNEPATKTTASGRAVIVPVAVAFMIMLVGLGSPAAALTINLSVITDVINAFIDLIEPLTNLIVAIVPLWFIMQILGFIMGLLAAILAMIKFGRKM